MKKTKKTMKLLMRVFFWKDTLEFRGLLNYLPCESEDLPSKIWMYWWKGGMPTLVTDWKYYK